MYRRGLGNGVPILYRLYSLSDHERTNATLRIQQYMYMILVLRTLLLQ